jgi:hypothetical protein
MPAIQEVGHFLCLEGGGIKMISPFLFHGGYAGRSEDGACLRL